MSLYIALLQFVLSVIFEADTEKCDFYMSLLLTKLTNHIRMS